jgi:hypothetical protein
MPQNYEIDHNQHNPLQSLVNNANNNPVGLTSLASTLNSITSNPIPNVMGQSGNSLMGIPMPQGQLNPNTFNLNSKSVSNNNNPINLNPTMTGIPNIGPSFGFPMQGLSGSINIAQLLALQSQLQAPSVGQNFANPTQPNLLNLLGASGLLGQSPLLQSLTGNISQPDPRLDPRYTDSRDYRYDNDRREDRRDDRPRNERNSKNDRKRNERRDDKRDTKREDMKTELPPGPSCMQGQPDPSVPSTCVKCIL